MLPPTATFGVGAEVLAPKRERFKNAGVPGGGQDGPFETHVFDVPIAVDPSPVTVEFDPEIIVPPPDAVEPKMQQRKKKKKKHSNNSHFYLFMFFFLFFFTV